MKRLLLVLLSSPTLFVSVLLMSAIANPAYATEKVTPATNHLMCVRPRASLTCVRVMPSDNVGSPAQPSNDDTPMLEFTDEESDAAVQLFGCDCPPCINALRQLRGLSPLA